MIGGVYDAQMVAVDALGDSQLQSLDPGETRERTRHLFRDLEFDTAVRLSTNTSARVSYRIEKTIALLEN
ncbi:hypothetical protein ASD18_12180 [Cellulomonas sp. Root137]|nr:hypothetical protein ASD18_12180 [Cellulomonas sp. Root137]